MWQGKLSEAVDCFHTDADVCAQGGDLEGEVTSVRAWLNALDSMATDEAVRLASVAGLRTLTPSHES